MTYLIPRTLKHETKMFKRLYIRDLIYIGLILSIGFLFKRMVHIYLIIPYWIFFFGVSIYMVTRPESNPNKRKFQALAMFLFRDNSTYYSINQVYGGDNNG